MNNKAALVVQTLIQASLQRLKLRFCYIANIVQIVVVGILLIMLFAPTFAATMTIPKGESRQCQRIVSISPALSDMLVEMELEEHIVGATRYDRLPATEKREIIGGYFDLNIEKVVSLKPDIVFLEGNVNNSISERLATLGVKNRVYALDTIEEIEAAKQEIGHYCEGKMEIHSQTLKDQLAALTPLDELDQEKPRVLILYNYGDHAETILPKLAAGRSFHGELLETLGMRNVYLGSLNAPELTREAISILNPEWIFILNGAVDDTSLTRNELVVKQLSPRWEFLSRVDAVKNHHVYEIFGFYTQIPSVSAMKQLAALFAQLVYGIEIEDQAVSTH
ncbi:ABC transporter substrate-binding protein [Ignatzschineria indica]|uniref:ABC transporter substrate-binding protein n=1 Tax=Ignatzschineria indica TaxID=472583 RepID=UPI0025769A64|nr:ABC transporter substrate-binding protein [Ignatzschineria indica]MDM1545069.1 ABC transporter substrate-binding protein [Ignatzschineria indica]